MDGWMISLGVGRNLFVRRRHRSTLQIHATWPDYTIPTWARAAGVTKTFLRVQNS